MRLIRRLLLLIVVAAAALAGLVYLFGRMPSLPRPLTVIALLTLRVTATSSRG